MKLINKQLKKTKILTAIVLASSVLLSACGEATAPKKAPLSQYTEQGNTYLEQFQFKAAITSARNAIITYPEKIDGYLILAKIYLQLGQPESSSLVLKQFKNDKNSEYYFLLLEAYLKDNKPVSATHLIATNKNILQLEPNRLKKEQAKIALRNKKIEEAFSLFKELESTSEFKSDALIGQARIAALSNDTQGAIVLLNQTIEDDPTNSEAMLLKSYLLKNENKLAEAEKMLSHTLTILPSSDIFTPERINVLQALTEVLTAQGRSSEALLYSRILSDEFPEAASINQNYAEATKQYKNNEYGLAKQTLERIFKIAPSHKKSLTLYGVILYKQGDIKGAHKYLNGLVDPEKNSEALTQLYAMTQLKLDNATDVLVMLENTISTEESYQTLALYLLAAIDQQQFSKAKFALTRIEKLFPDSEKSILLAANYYSKVKPVNHDKALNILQQGLKNNPNNSELQTAFLKKLISLKKDSEANTYIQQLQKDKNSSIETQLLVAKYKLYQTHYQQANKLFNAILAQQENNLTAQLGLVQSQQQTDSWLEAKKTYRNIILFHPKEIKGYQGFIFTRLKLKEDIEQLADVLPGNYDKSLLSLALADTLLQQNKIPQAQTQINIASKGVASHLQPYLKELQYKINFQEALIALSNKEFNTARTIALTALKGSPDNPNLLLLLTKIEIESGQLKEARSILQQVEKILSNEPIISIYQADIALAEGDSEKAIKILNDKWQSTHNDKVAQKLYLLLMEKDKKQADEFLTLWQQKAPKSLAATLSKAMLLQEKGDAKEALKLYEKVLELRPNELTSLNNAAWLYSTLGNSRGEALARRAFKLAPNNPAILDTYGWTLYKSGQTETAKPLIKKAHELAPDNADIKAHWLAVKDI